GMSGKLFAQAASIILPGMPSVPPTTSLPIMTLDPPVDPNTGGGVGQPGDPNGESSAFGGECAYGAAGSPSAGCDFTQPATPPPDNSCFEPGGLCDDNNRIPEGIINNPATQAQLNQCLGDQSPCDAWYLRMSRCLTCSAEDRARLVGYWQTCRNM